MTEIVIAPTGAAPAGGVEAPAEVPGEHRGAPRDGAPRDGAPRDGVSRDGQRRGMDPLFGVRTADIEPYTGLRYLSKLFRMIAVVLVLLLIAEVATGLYHDGADALSTLLAEVSRLIVLAGLLWGVGDLAILLIDVGHDVRAARILVGRQTLHLSQAHEQHAYEQHAHDLPPAAAGAPTAGASAGAPASAAGVR